MPEKVLRPPRSDQIRLWIALAFVVALQILLLEVLGSQALVCLVLTGPIAVMLLADLRTRIYGTQEALVVVAPGHGRTKSYRWSQIASFERGKRSVRLRLNDGSEVDVPLFGSWDLPWMGERNGRLMDEQIRDMRDLAPSEPAGDP